jgi:hypothetical protein
VGWQGFWDVDVVTYYNMRANMAVNKVLIIKEMKSERGYEGCLAMD